MAEQIKDSWINYNVQLGVDTRALMRWISLEVGLLLLVMALVLLWNRRLNREINQRRDTEQALLEAEDRSRLILASADESIFGLDTEGRTKFVNPAAALMVGYTENRRPAYDRLYGAIVRREIDLVMAWSVDRLGRSLQQLVALLSDLHAKDIDLYLHQQGIDTTTPAGKAMFQRTTWRSASMCCWENTDSEVAMTTISFEFDPSAFGALRLAPNEFAREMRIAAAVQWYAQGVVSKGKAAELAGLTRADFLDEPHRRKVPACQVTPDELADEIHGT